MTTSNITQQKYTVTVTEGATTLVTVKAVGPQGPQGALQTGDVGDFTVSVANDGTQSAVINTGAVTSSKILDGTIVNADINASASIDGTKISPNFGSQNISTTGTVGGLDLSTYQANGGSYLRSDADDSFTGTLTGTSDMTNPVILIKGGGPNFIRFDSNDGVSADTIDLIYRTTPNTLAFERRSDSQIMFSVDADDQQAIFNGNVDCNSGLDVSGGDITGVLGSAVTGTTQSASDNSTKIATTSYVDTAVSNLVNSAPSTLDTLGEIATALNNDAALNTTLTNSIATKLPLAGGTLTGDLTISTTAPLIKFDETDQTTDYFIVANNNTLTLTRNNLNSPNHIQKWNSDGHVDFLTNVDFASGIDVTGDLTVTTGALTITNAAPEINFVDNTENDDFQIKVDGGFFKIIDATNTQDRMVINSNGIVTFGQNVDFSSGIDVTGDITGTGDLILTADTPKIQLIDNNADDDFQISNFSGNFIIKDITNSVDRFTIQSDGTIDVANNLNVGAGLDVTGQITGTSHIDLPDDAFLKLGDSDEFQIYHRGNDGVSLINEQGGGYLSFGSNGSRVEMYDIANARVMAKFNVGGSCEFKHAADIRLETNSTGIAVTGRIAQSDTAGGANTFGTNIQINTIFPAISLNDSDSENDFQIINANGLFKIRDFDREVDVFTIEGRSGESNYGETGIAGNLSVTGDLTLTSSSPKLILVDDNNSDYQIKVNAGNFQIEDISASGSPDRFSIDSNGDVTITGELEAKSFRFGDSHVKRISVDYTGEETGGDGSPYLNDNEFQEILTITPSSSSQNYSVIGRIMAASGTFVHTIDINIGLRSNTLPDLAVSGSYISTIIGTTEFLTPRLWLKETTTAAFKLVVEINARIFGRVTADLEIIARNEADLNNIVVNEDETSEVTSLPTGYAQTTPTKVYETDDGAFAFDGGLTAGGNIVATGDGTFDDIRIGEHAGNNDFGGIFHKNQSGTEYMMISKDEHTFISASTGFGVSIVGGNNVFANNIQVHPANGVNITAANNVNILDGNLSFVNNSDASPYILMKGANGKVKFSVWDGIDSNGNAVYGIGMLGGMSYGSIGNQNTGVNTEFATTFQMNNSNSRGWVFLDSSHTNAQGAMSLTTQGRMTVAHSMRLGYGESDTTESGATHALDVSGSISSTSTISATTSNASSSTDLRKITTSTSQPSGGADGDIWIVVPS